MLEAVLDHPRDQLLGLPPLDIERCPGPAWRADPTPALHQGFLLPETPLPVEGVETGAVLGWINTDKAQRAAELGQDRGREEFWLRPLVHVHVPTALD